MRDLLESAGTDAIGALLVFLNLLEGDAEAEAELLLTETLEHSAQSDLLSDVNINRIGLLFCHLLFAPTSFPMERRIKS
jgi:hypothetical protein